MTTKKWIEIAELGELRLEIVLVHFDVPLLFVCQSGDGVRYLVLCIDEEEGRYLCSRISNCNLLKLLNNEITMAEAFRHPVDKKDFLIEYDFSNMRFNGHYINISELTADMLPDEGAYFRLKNQKITDYIKKIADEKEYQHQNITSYSTKRNIEISTRKYTNNLFRVINNIRNLNNHSKNLITVSDLEFTISYTEQTPKCSYVFINNSAHGGNDNKAVYNTERICAEKCLAKM